jgi:hypothetical protein
MSKHTKAPWQVGNKGHNANIVYSGDSGIADVYGIYQHTSLEEILLDKKCAEGLANARLIAAAPELLEALENAQATIHLIAHHENRKSYAGCQDCASVRDLIAKAKGE